MVGWKGEHESVGIPLLDVQGAEADACGRVSPDRFHNKIVGGYPRQLLPGDLAVWDGHVAMVVGNGVMIEAGDPVGLSPIRTTNLGQGFQGFWRPTA